MVSAADGGPILPPQRDEPAHGARLGQATSIPTARNDAMLHYSCDFCKRILDPRDDLRYVVRVEVYAAMDQRDDDIDDHDHLEEVQDILQRAESSEHEAVGDDVYQQLRFDLCPECRRKFLQNPLGRESSKQFDFSSN
jgi:hypothetical protein